MGLGRFLLFGLDAAFHRKSNRLGPPLQRDSHGHPVLTAPRFYLRLRGNGRITRVWRFCFVHWEIEL